jgi:hypothetical protein
VKLKVDGLIADTIKKLTGASVASLVQPGVSVNERIKKLTEFKNKLEHWLENYAKALESLQSEDDCKKWDGVAFVGERALDVLPFF